MFGRHKEEWNKHKFENNEEQGRLEEIHKVLNVVVCGSTSAGVKSEIKISENKFNAISN